MVQQQYVVVAPWQQQHVAPRQTGQQWPQQWNVSKKLLSQGSGGCIYSPPIISGLNNNMTEIYPKDKERGNTNYNIFDNKKFVGKLLIEQFLNNEKNNYIIAMSTKSDHIPQLKYAGTINNINSVFSNLENCKLLYTYPNQKWGYMIIDHVGISLADYDINKNNIINILHSLITAIENFIIKLNSKNYLHGDINLRNITYNDDIKKIYFIDFDKMSPKNSSDPHRSSDFDIFCLHLLVYNIFFVNNSVNYDVLHAKKNDLQRNPTTLTHKLVQQLLHPFNFRNFRVFSIFSPIYIIKYEKQYTYTYDNLKNIILKIIKSLEIENKTVSISTSTSTLNRVQTSTIRETPTSTLNRAPTSTMRVAQTSTLNKTQTPISHECWKIIRQIQKFKNDLEDKTVYKSNKQIEILNNAINEDLQELLNKCGLIQTKEKGTQGAQYENILNCENLMKIIMKIITDIDKEIKIETNKEKIKMLQENKNKQLKLFDNQCKNNNEIMLM